jgi:hypothetical protein
LKLSEAMTRRLKQFARNPEPILLTHQLQRSAAALYALGMLTWSRKGYRVSEQGQQYLNDHTEMKQ